MLYAFRSGRGPWTNDPFQSRFAPLLILALDALLTFGLPTNSELPIDSKLDADCRDTGL